MLNILITKSVWKSRLYSILKFPFDGLGVILKLYKSEFDPNLMGGFGCDQKIGGLVQDGERYAVILESQNNLPCPLYDTPESSPKAFIEDKG